MGLSSLPRTLRPAVWEWQDLWAGLPFCPEVGDRAGSVFSADICCRFLEAAFPPPGAEELTLTTGKNMVQGKYTSSHLVPLFSSRSPFASGL